MHPVDLPIPPLPKRRNVTRPSKLDVEVWSAVVGTAEDPVQFEGGESIRGSLRKRSSVAISPEMFVSHVYVLSYTFAILQPVKFCFRAAWVSKVLQSGGSSWKERVNRRVRRRKHLVNRLLCEVTSWC